LLPSSGQTNKREGVMALHRIPKDSNISFTFLYYATSCNLIVTDVSEKPAASIFKVEEEREGLKDNPETGDSRLVCK
jgi:hypothetical protein